MIIDTNRQVNFGVYKGSKFTDYGKRIYGEYKGKNIDVYDDNKNKMKLFYISDKFGKWIKSKLVYFDKEGNKKVIKSENKGGWNG